MSDLKVVLYDDVQQLRTLEVNWIALTDAVPTHSACQDFDFALYGWETLPKGPDVKLAVVTVWRDEAMVCAWPLYSQRKGMVTVACHLGSGDLHEYAGPLVRNDDDTLAVVHAALDALKTVVDVVKIYNLHAPSRTVEAISSYAAPKRGSTTTAPVVSLAGVSDWDNWSKTMSKKFRASLRYYRKNLAEMGELDFRLMVGPDEGVRCMAWIFEAKREWLVAQKIEHSFFLNPQIEAFFMKLSERALRTDGRPYGVQTYAMTLDDKIIAACICLNSGDRIEYHTTTFDPAYGLHSPGSLLIQDCVMMCIDRGVDFDFRMGQSSYKSRWSDRQDRLQNFNIAFTPKGRLAVTVEAAQAAVHGLRVKYGPRIKALLRRGRTEA